MRVSKKKYTARPIKASEEGAVDIAPEATELLFETPDVADLIAEVTGEDVSVEADEDQVVFTVGEDEFVVEAEGDEELLEACTRVRKSARPVKASRTAKPAPKKLRRR